MRQDHPGKMRILVMSATIATCAMPGLAQAPQVPTRPSLPSAEFTPGSPGGTTEFRSTNLVQRDFEGNGQGQFVQGQPGQGQPVSGQPAPRASQSEFFYLDEQSQAAENFAGDLSTFNEQRLDQAGAQLRGNYGPLSRAGLPAGMTQQAWDRPFDNMSAGQSAPGTIRYQWSADMVMPVRLRAGMVTNLAFPEWEAIEDVMIGDGGAVEARILRPNQLAVKSLQNGVDTSLSVVGGTGNIYTFYLRTEGRNTTLVTDLQVFIQAAPSKGSADWFNDSVSGAFTGGAGGTRAMNGGAASDDGDGVRPADTQTERAGAHEAYEDRISLRSTVSQGDEPVPTDKRIFDMKMFEVNEGDRVIAPEYVYTDGRFTYLHYAQGVTDRPAVFRIVDGVEGRVNTRVTGRFSEVIVIEAIGDFVLRSGSRAVCIMQADASDAVMARK